MTVSEERIKTNHMLMDELDMWDEFTVKAINDEWTLRYYTLLMNLLNSQVDEAVKWLDTEESQEYYYDEAQYQYQLFKALEDQWDEILENKYPSVEALLQEVYNRGKAKGYADMREHIRFTDTDKRALQFVRDYNFDLIQNIDYDTRNHIKNIITSAVIGGENPRKVSPKIKDTLNTRLEGSTFTPTQRAVMIARTEISRTQNTGILQSYINEGYTEVKILTAEDNNVCYTCLSYAYEFNEETPVIFENHGEEKIHNIIELLKGEKFPPFHPNCRCTYTSVWETKDHNITNPDIVRLVSQRAIDKIREKKYVKEIRKKTSSRRTPKQVAKKFGFKYSYENQNHIFEDLKNNTKIIIKKKYFENTFRENLIDFTNSGKGRYDLEEVLMIYNNAPTIYKQAPKEIVFTKQPLFNEVCGHTFGFDKDTLKIINRVEIYPSAFKINRLYRANFANTLYHEMGHCINNCFVNKIYLDAIYHLNKYSTKELDKIFKYQKLNTISHSDDYEEARMKDEVFQRRNNLPIVDSSYYGLNNPLESWAELASMFAFNDLEDKTMAVMETQSHEMIPFEEWKNQNPYKYEFIVKKMKEIESLGLDLSTLE